MRSIFGIFEVIFCFDAVVCDLVHDVETLFDLL